MAFKPIRSYSVGDVIFNEKPIVHVVDNNQKSLKCDFCLKCNQSLKKCSKCAKMYYCDRECQRNDWHSHKNECKIYAQCYDKCLNDFFMRLLMRLWLLIKKDKSLLTKKYQLFNGNYRCLNDLESHQKEIELDENRMNQFNKLCQNFTICGIEYSTEELFKLYGQLLINIYSIVIHDMTYENIKSGFGLFICSSIFDHSCSPNACIVSSGLNLQIRAIKEIAKNEEIFIHYIPLNMNKTERKAKLKSQYYFECNCNKCESDEDNRIDYQKFKSLQNQLQLNFISGKNYTFKKRFKFSNFY
jgi:SET and MYND domain-containing protein